jgi:hypothetical protein
MTQEPQQIPPGATPIDMEELFASIGELYVQVRIQRRTIQAILQQAPPTSPPVAYSTTPP